MLRHILKKAEKKSPLLQCCAVKDIFEKKIQISFRMKGRYNFPFKIISFEKCFLRERKSRADIAVGAAFYQEKHAMTARRASGPPRPHARQKREKKERTFKRQKRKGHVYGPQAIPGRPMMSAPVRGAYRSERCPNTMLPAIRRANFFAFAPP